MGSASRRCFVCQGLLLLLQLQFTAPCFIICIVCFTVACCTHTVAIAAVPWPLPCPNLLQWPSPQSDSFGVVAMDGLPLSSGHGDLKGAMDVEGRALHD